MRFVVIGVLTMSCALFAYGVNELYHELTGRSLAKLALGALIVEALAGYALIRFLNAMAAQY